MTYKDNIERRAAELEVRAKGRRLEGYAATFNTRTKIADFEEEIRSGAFAASLLSGDKLALVDHDPNKLLGRTKSGTLKLAEDQRGLHFEVALPSTSVANDVLALAERGDLGGCSFGFLVKRDAWSGSVRTLEEVDLREISIVSSWPAYPATSVTARSLAAAHRSVDQLTIDLLQLGAR